MISSVVFLARGMHCHGCEHIIERAARSLPGVRRISADYPTETVSVDFDSGLTSLDEISRINRQCRLPNAILEPSCASAQRIDEYRRIDHGHPRPVADHFFRY